MSASLVSFLVIKKETQIPAFQLPLRDIKLIIWLKKSLGLLELKGKPLSRFLLAINHSCPRNQQFAAISQDLEQPGLPDKLKGVVNETRPIVTADCRVCSFEETSQGIPSIILIVHDVIAVHPHIKLDPFHCFWKDEHI